MDDKPILGTHGEPPDEPDSSGLVLGPDFGARPASNRAEGAPSEGVILIDPRPKDPPPVDEQDPTTDGLSGRWRAVLWGTGLAVIVGVGLVLRAVLGPTPIDEQAVLPPMVRSSMGAVGASQSLSPVEPEVVAPVGTQATLSFVALGPGRVPLADTVVALRVESGDGSLVQDRVRTDADGYAHATLALPPVPGVTVILADLPGASVETARVVMTAVAGVPARIQATAGEAQTAGAGELLPQRLQVRVTDEQDNPVGGVIVNFRVQPGSGLAAPTETRTDSLGRASALWRLGPTAGAQELLVTSPDIGQELSFEATAQPRVRPAGREDLSAGVIVGPVTVRASTFAIGGSHVCELAGGAARCRGATDRGQVSATGRGFVALTSGISHVCGLAQDGRAFCWGANESGQVGDGSSMDRSEPVPVRTELRFSSLTAGAAHTCGLAGGGIPACWGLNLSGQLGDGSRNDQRGPRTVGGGLAFQGLTAGWNHTCGITASGNAFCWGLNSQGQLGDGSRLDRLVPTLVRGSVETLVAGSAHTCGLTEGQVMCWGANAFGQLGDGTFEDRSQPVNVLGLPQAPRVLTAGAVHTCGLMADGTAYCWGQNLQGQLGDGSTANRARAVPVAGGLRFQEIHAGGALTCGRTFDGAQYCWGLNSSGQVGDGTRVSRSSPTRVSR